MKWFLTVMVDGARYARYATELPERGEIQVTIEASRPCGFLKDECSVCALSPSNDWTFCQQPQELTPAPDVPRETTPPVDHDSRLPLPTLTDEEIKALPAEHFYQRDVPRETSSLACVVCGRTSCTHTLGYEL